MYTHMTQPVMQTQPPMAQNYISGLEIREPKAPLNSPAATSYFCREPKDVLVSIHNTFRKLLKTQFWVP